MTDQYKLTYFPVKALAEPIRFLLSYSGVDFEDVRLGKEKWSEIKPDTPFGQVPILEVNGKLAHQSIAIARYLAKQTDLMGNDDWENLEIDAIVDTISDLRSKISAYNVEADDEKKIDMREVLFTETLPYYLAKLDDIAKENDGHLALKKLTWADLYFTGIMEYCNGVTKMDLIENYPYLIQVRETVHSIPAIKSWLEKRPESEY